MTDNDLRETLTTYMNERWREFKEHRPTGAYFPVGQLDGDCHGKTCGGTWPCEHYLNLLVPVVEAYAAGREAQALSDAADDLPARTEGLYRSGTHGWRENDRDVYSLAIEEAQDVLRARAAEAGEQR